MGEGGWGWVGRWAGEWVARWVGSCVIYVFRILFKDLHWFIQLSIHVFHLFCVFIDQFMDQLLYLNYLLIYTHMFSFM